MIYIYILFVFFAHLGCGEKAFLQERERERCSKRNRDIRYTVSSEASKHVRIMESAGDSRHHLALDETKPMENAKGAWKIPFGSLTLTDFRVWN